MNGSQSDILFIAEVSANHLGSFERANQIVEAAARAGATAVKFQTYKPETMTLDLPQFSISDDHSLWGGRRLFDLYKEAQTPWEWHEALFEKARELGLIPFSSPFDTTAVNFLESLDAPMYKIASMETSDHRLIKTVAETGKPVIVSTGATEWSEIEEVVEIFQSVGNSDLTLLVCTSSYPSNPEESHINRMATLRDAFDCKVGLSDHTLGIGVSVAAVALGATAIEKHLTLRRSDGGADGAFSMEPHEFSQMVIQAGIARKSLGSKVWRVQPSELESRRIRRSLYVVTDVVAGDTVTYENVRAIRPGGGGHPRNLDKWLGMKFIENCSAGTPLSLDILK